LPVVRGRCIDRDKFKIMVDEYYQHHGWGKDGVPTKKKLKELGLEQEPSNLL
jgi:aldehyde:ferredoxin oxidoreductase